MSTRKPRREQEPIREPVHYITCELSHVRYAIPIDQVQEVVELKQVLPSTTGPVGMRGTVEVRGRAVPVVDLWQKFGLPPANDSPSSRIVVLQLVKDGQTLLVGGVADSVRNVVELRPDGITNLPRLEVAHSMDFIRGAGITGKRLMTILDLQKVFTGEASHYTEKVNSPAADTKPVPKKP